MMRVLIVGQREEQVMTAMATGESLTGEFDLDIRIDDLDPAEPDRVHRAMTADMSCTFCCLTAWCLGHQSDDCNLTIACTGNACAN
jgi:hypothetical protein